MDTHKCLATHGMRSSELRREFRMPACFPALAAACFAQVALAASAWAAPATPPPRLSATAWPVPPFQAWAGAESMWVRAEPRLGSRLAGLLHRGDVVTVTACVPDCASPRAWAQLGADGAVPLKPLRLMPVPPDAARTSGLARYIYGWVPRAKTPVFAKPDPKSRTLRKETAQFRLAFVIDPAQQAKGWLQRPDGGWMRTKDIKLFTPSTFVGVHEAQAGPFVFVRRKVNLRQVDKKAAPIVLSRYQTLPLLGVKPGRVQVPGGSLGRNAVRVVRAYARPPEAKPADRWLHIDLTEQVLTAYEGDKLVFATLVSTGKDDRKSHMTKEGTFAIYARSVHSSMRGKPWDDYFAEQVPFTMHFDAGRALHGAYWHDQFGVKKSHGCVNLSLADAEWVFNWAPPGLPTGWSAVLPVPGKQPMVPVVVEKKGRFAPSSLAFGGKGSQTPVRVGLAGQQPASTVAK